MSDVSQTLIDSIGDSLGAYGFHDRWRPALSALDCRGHWRLSTFTTNRAVSLLIPPSADLDLGSYCQRMKWRLLRKMWFVPLLYEVSLQLVLVGDNLEKALAGPASLRAHVDNFSNQLVVLQSIFVVDTATKRFTGAKTWGQVLTGKYQDAIAEGIHSAGFRVM